MARLRRELRATGSRWEWNITDRLDLDEQRDCVVGTEGKLAPLFWLIATN
jgi:hypothetical protein